MNTYYIEAFDIPEVWYLLLNLCVDKGRDYKIDKGSYEGQYRKELDYITFKINNPSFRPMIPIIPPELGLQPPTDMDYVNRYFEEYLLSPLVAENETYTYGSRIGMSLFKVVDMLKNTPNTNQAILQVGQPTDVFISDPPCLRHIDCRILDGKLHFIIYFRSWDLWGGLPGNLAGLQLLKEFMVEQIDCEDGCMICSSKGLHLYDYAWEFAKTRVYK